MATTSIPTGSAQQSTLSEWAGPYVTNMLGKAGAISDTPYQTYQGPMTAGQSNLQSKVFQGLGNLSFPGNLGQSFSSPGAYQPPSFGQANPIGVGGPMAPYIDNATYGPSSGTSEPMAYGIGDAAYSPNSGMSEPMPPGPMGQPGQPSNIAQQYMNPYLEAVLNPQLAELNRQNSITQNNTNATAANKGAFGGSRQAIINAENNRNLMQEMNKTVGQGYANAYDKAMGQFNTEQGQAKTLADMMGAAGASERAIEQEGITADLNEFLAQRDYPQKMLQFQQSMLQGLPISTVSATQLPQSGIGQLTSTVGGLGSLMTSLKSLNLT